MYPDPVHELIEDLYPGSSGMLFIVNSNHVAEALEAPHADIVAIIAGLEIDDETRRDWFRDQTDKTVDMIAEGFVAVVMGWPGEDGLRIKQRVMRTLFDFDKDADMRRKFIGGLLPALAPIVGSELAKRAA